MFGNWDELRLTTGFLPSSMRLGFHLPHFLSQLVGVLWSKMLGFLAKGGATSETGLIIIPLKHLQLGTARSLLTHPRSRMYSTATPRVFLGSKLLFWMQRLPSGALLGSSACHNFLTDWSALACICYMLCLGAVCNSCGLMFIFGVISVRVQSAMKFYRGVHLALFYFCFKNGFSSSSTQSYNRPAKSVLECLQDLSIKNWLLEAVSLQMDFSSSTAMPAIRKAAASQAVSQLSCEPQASVLAIKSFW